MSIVNVILRPEDGRREWDSDSVSKRQKAEKRTRTGKEKRYNNPTIIVDKALRKVI